VTPPLRLALPFQTVEIVNESAPQRQRALDLFSEGRDPAWRNCRGADLERAAAFPPGIT